MLIIGWCCSNNRTAATQTLYSGLYLELFTLVHWWLWSPLFPPLRDSPVRAPCLHIVCMYISPLIFILEKCFSVLRWFSTKMRTLIEIYANFGLRGGKYGCNTPDSSWYMPSSIISSLRWWWVLMMITLAVVPIFDERFYLLCWCSTKGSILIWIYAKFVLLTKINHPQVPYRWRDMDI